MVPFRLASLFRVRQIQEDRAAAELAAAAEERAYAENLTERARRRLEESELPESADVLLWQAAVASRTAASTTVRDAAAAHEAAKQQEESAHALWTAARTRTTMIEKLADRHELAQHEELVRKEQHVLDEIAAQRSRQEESH